MASVWSRDERILALYFYFQTKGQIPSPNSPVAKEFLERINSASSGTGSRNMNAFIMKFQDFRSIDPYDPRGSDTLGSALDREVWMEFAGKPERLASVVASIEAGRSSDAVSKKSSSRVTGSYKNPDAFPFEKFVQRCIENHFEKKGFEVYVRKMVDLACLNRASGEHWIIEAKGETSQVGLDFRTGLGQLLQAMDDPEANYAIAVPETDRFLFQVNRLPTWVRKSLGLNVIFVQTNGTVRIDECPRGNN